MDNGNSTAINTSTAETKENTVKRAVVLQRENLNGGLRRYIYDRHVRDSYEKMYKYIQSDIKLLNFAMDEVGLISDCHILFAIAMMGAADLDSIRLFLNALSNKNKDLNIPSMSDPDPVRKRLQSLTKSGFLFKHQYSVKCVNDAGEPVENRVSIYTIPKSTQTFMNHRLSKKTTVNEWMQTKPLYEIIGWCACSYVQGRIAQNNYFIEQKQGVFKTPVMGTAVIPGVLKMNTVNGDEAYVGFIPSFLHFDKSFQTENDFEDACKYMVKLISQFLFFHDRKKHIARVVVVVEDNPDLVQAVKWIHSSGALEDDYDRIYFTGEGIVKRIQGSQLPGGFIQIRRASTKTGYTYLPGTPDFLERRD